MPTGRPLRREIVGDCSTIRVRGPLGRCSHLVRIDMEEIGEHVERTGQRTDARQRLLLVVAQVPGLRRRQPEEVEQPAIACEQVGAQRASAPSQPSSSSQPAYADSPQSSADTKPTVRRVPVASA